MPRTSSLAFRSAAAWSCRVVLAAVLMTILAPRAHAAPPDLAVSQCQRTIIADVVALDQPIFYNRFGAYDPAGMIFALRRDVVPISGSKLTPGNVRLRDGKRPRPLTLRANVGDCLQIKFENLLARTPADNEQPATRAAGIHVMGMQLVRDILDDGSFVGANQASVGAPGAKFTYRLYAQREGTFLLYSTGANVGGEGGGGSLSRGLFGAVNVQPYGAEWYRSQLTADELRWATTGNTPAGQPIINYDAVYPIGHPFAGQPILAMLKGNEIFHSELNAIITGPNKGSFYCGWDSDPEDPEDYSNEDDRRNCAYPAVKVAGDRLRPYREFTVIFHDEIGVLQAFPEFDDPRFEFTLHGGRDGFAVNYAADGAGATVLANRFGVGPSWNCSECKYEEFFLSSWSRGDPGTVVDVPANVTDLSGSLIKGPKATKVLYADDPANVHHAYLNDRIIINNLHAGPKEHHVFHLHAHQWLQTPDADNSDYLDSQTIGPGGGFRYELTYSGAGNRNLTAGDAIFHCHFYPHFAQGMWGLMRVHDVLETGTVLDGNGRPASGARALPDGEIAAGVPIPAVVPLPGAALPPMPGTRGNPGYPFFVPGVAGRRAPQPPLDFARDAATGELLHGGLPRHVVRGGTSEFPELNTLSFAKHNLTLDAQELPHGGTTAELKAMDFHGRNAHSSYRVDPVSHLAQPSAFRTNGASAVAGAPFADPCRTYGEQAASRTRVYKGASFQMDAKYNKAGWHFAQHRMYALWEDVRPTLEGQKAPEPLFMRTNTGDCIEFHLVNLVPNEYIMDDFQVTTPTDIMGQHIHLVKFDKLASDGGANGWNYEDGSMAPGEVVERINAIRRHHGCTANDARNGTIKCPVAKAHPAFAWRSEWLGAQQTIQRWYTDDVLNAAGTDRTLRTIFTHDHFAPSTTQQVGLYGALAAEPRDSRWFHPETGVEFGTRHDGGPTSWQAIIRTADPKDSYREFLLATADFVPAYDKRHQGIGPNPPLAINAPGREKADLPFLTKPPFRAGCPNGDPAPCPESLSADHPGTMLVNYRNEPLALRVRDPSTNRQATGNAGDLSLAFQSRTNWVDRDFRQQPSFYPALTGGVGRGDPFTPLIRAYEGDRVQIRVLTGAQEHGHNIVVHGMKWLREPSWPNSGYTASQMVSISERFELNVPTTPDRIAGNQADYIWMFGASADDLWNGAWGIFRSYRQVQKDLLPLPSNQPQGKVFAFASNANDFNGICPKTAPVRRIEVSAVLARDVLPEGTLIYNARPGLGGPLHDPTAILYVRTEDLGNNGKLKPGVPVEPLILRANAGDCIDLKLENRLPATLPDLDGFSTLPSLVDRFNANQIRPSSSVGLHAQLVTMDVTRSAGIAVGNNPMSLAAPNDTTKYRWYAGRVDYDPATRRLTAVPLELGAANLISSDRIKHSMKGAVGALVIQPRGATWQEDADSRASATVTKYDGTSFREFVVIVQNDLNLRFGDGSAIPTVALLGEDSEETGHKAYNYRTEPTWFRMGYAPETSHEQTRGFDFTNLLSNLQVGGDPQTPVFVANAGEPVRFRLLHPAGGRQREHSFTVHGHGWAVSPYQYGATKLGHNPVSRWVGSVDGIGPSGHYDLLLTHGAGGAFKVPGDYLFRDFTSSHFENGLWGILRVRER